MALILILILILVVVAALVVSLLVWRQRDHQADRAEMARLIALQPADPPCFSVDMLAGLPEPARRFFTFAIAEGTPLRTVARIEMTGQFGMGDKAKPNYLRMQATQVLAAPEGFVWAMSGGSGALRLSGSDSGKWTRFWLLWGLPVARFGGNGDHRPSAFGRYVAEAVFWTPAAVLPGPNVTWAHVSQDVARMTMRHAELEQSVELTLAEDGRPLQVSFLRWSDANPEKAYRLQPFGGYLSEFRVFDGFRLPTHVEAGNMFETDAYFPFFRADVTAISFPEPDP
ncbi:conserved hypothetical protein [Dinoroseobacter shibae DFL 12 = DSM 16493]|jgi:hypothetical protein|uniref:Uncharacterized protein n=1 Tax=Dinoroseobacter shibae (strain DSM 16493 / NCIMB 14021 / DFL 12) TaxID=398580 RepID=A8LRX9_DINSH|nr:DUF6544 family protein [Dinoroseobacter shibae]ABV92686.1 conserved hypothetical protein [Dinoroseobacter shibae DFL 12 = DSM 16493]URF47619.1 hypothetical protein M8008_04855 [Dinoroseobacter shibae]URF51929.1 hypothetical protein M8007_04855 [Dinoroseobacter shibae]